MRHAVINDENVSFNLREPAARITRARAKVSGSSEGLPPLYPSAKLDGKRFLRKNFKRAAPDNKEPGTSSAAPQLKKRVVLEDVSNIKNENFNLNWKSAAGRQSSKQGRKNSLLKHENVATARSEESQVQENKRENGMEEMELLEESLETCSTICPKNAEPCEMIIAHRSLPAEDVKLCNKQENLPDRGIIDIDSKHKDPQMCSIYVVDIYNSLHAAELDRRPLLDYMEMLQQDITPGMRGVLIDWLVEVSEEYKLVPDTLYLTVDLIDRYLSENYIEKQNLQLLGVTCMLIASKYEEISAPCVEEFCFITDNTYKKKEVVKMESRVLNVLGFQISVPTTKKFLRRFIQAAQVFYKVPTVELEFLANFLAELTLFEYSFLKFLPSLIAASAVFLARWTLDQSEHPWNPTLEYYTRYKTAELKRAVLELQDLQLNTSGCLLNAIRDKFKQSKFKGVSTLRSVKPVQSLFT
ncbi:cyclin-A2-2 [Henckelia pumila]|uniref:cyclin-A2-2 n=1 Tax=Henckelia pumila TaxID=405737 RepID=UPI003C6DEDAB